MLKSLTATFYPQKGTYYAFGAVASSEIGGKNIRVRKSLGTDVERTAKARPPYYRRMRTRCGVEVLAGIAC